MALAGHLEQLLSEKREEWLRAGFEGEWLVVFDKLAEHFDTPEAAYEFAVANEEPGQFLIQQIRREGRPESMIYNGITGTWPQLTPLCAGSAGLPNPVPANL